MELFGDQEKRKINNENHTKATPSVTVIWRHVEKSIYTNLAGCKLSNTETYSANQRYYNEICGSSMLAMTDDAVLTSLVNVMRLDQSW